MNEIATIDANSLELIVKEKQLGILVTNARQVKEQVKAALPKYSVENYGEDNIAKAKADKAMLNKFSKEVNAKRLEIQREWMKPFDEFKAETDEIVSLVKEASSAIDEVVKGVDDRAKQEKKKAIEEIWGRMEFDLVSLNKVFNPKWLNKTYSLTSIESEIIDIIGSISARIATISTMGEDAEALKSYYLDTLSIDDTLQYHARLKENREKLAKQRAKEEARLEQNRNQAEAVTQTKEFETERQQESTAQTAVDMYERRFRVVCTRDQLIALGDFMNDNNIYFEKL